MMKSGTPKCFMKSHSVLSKDSLDDHESAGPGQGTAVNVNVEIIGSKTQV